MILRTLFRQIARKVDVKKFLLNFKQILLLCGNGTKCKTSLQGNLALSVKIRLL